MLPLLSYKLYKYKKEAILKGESRNKTSNAIKCSAKLNNSRIKIKKPTLMEITILLFGMFGVPLSYFIYWNVIDLFQSTKFNETILPIEKENKTYYFNPVTISIKHIIDSRMQNMHKYRFNYSWSDIDRRSDLSIEEYRDMYSGKWPVIITDCATKWPAFKKWNKQFFEKHYGKQLVTIKTMADNITETFAMPLEIYLKHLHEGSPYQWTYLNDEMFIPSRPYLQNDLGTCKELKEDFFQMFPLEVRPWWSFLLWGTRFSRSDLHIDPFNWTGTNMVISGLKRWKMFPPGQDHLLNVIPNQKYKFPINFYKYNSKIDCYKNEYLQKYPSLEKAKVIEFYQYPGELLIIPTGWFHQAFNEEVTLAVAGQLMNSDNYEYVLEELFKGRALPRDGYDISIGNSSPKEKVKTVLNRITDKIRQQGRETTEFVYNQLKKLAESSGLPIPPSILDISNLQQEIKNTKK